MKNPKRCSCPDIPNNSIHKIAAVVIKDGHILIVRSINEDIFLSLGGQHESGETREECLAREVLEEVGVLLSESTFLGRFKDKTPSNIPLVLDAYLVKINGIPNPRNEIEEIRWIGKDNSLKLGSGLKKFIIPKLVQKGLVNG